MKVVRDSTRRLVQRPRREIDNILNGAPIWNMKVRNGKHAGWIWRFI